MEAKEAAKEANPRLGESAGRLRHLAGRCRDLSELTAVPEVSRELTRIAADIDREAESIAPS